MTLTAPPRLLLVHAHPDDETLWTGGTIARYAARGVQVTVVTCTLGEEGEIIPEHLRGLASEYADQLGGYRVGELRAACSTLRVAGHRFLGGIGRWRDSGMVWKEPGRAEAVAPGAHPRSFALGDHGEQAGQLEAILRELKPQVVVTYAADGGYGHPDHVRAHEITTDAAERVPEVLRVFHTVPSRDAVLAGLRRLEHAEAMPFTLPQPHELPSVEDESITTVVDVGEQLPAKIAAMRAHGTQIRVWLDGSDSGTPTAGYALSNGVAQPVGEAEHYVLARGEGRGADTDLFGGLGLVGLATADKTVPPEAGG